MISQKLKTVKKRGSKARLLTGLIIDCLNIDIDGSE